jgi:CRISPR-associated protein Csh2
MSETIKTRSEILFLYDIADANPNGDPNDENRPRLDRESGRVKVTDVRLKRTIRDYLRDALGEEIFCREIEKDDGTIQEGKDRAEDFAPKDDRAKKDLTKDAGGKEEKKTKRNPILDKRDAIQSKVLDECIDVRLFGATIPVAGGKDTSKGSSVTLTGAVQFAMGGTLHRTETRFIKGTGAFAGGQGRERKTFREEYMLPYGLIAFYGIVNHQAAKTTRLTADDVEKLFEAIWFGTKGLITRSKFGQRPLLLLAVEYKPESSNSYIGRLDRYLKITKPQNFTGDFREEAIRGTEDYQLDLADLETALSGRKNKIEKLQYAYDSRLHLVGTAPAKDTFLGLPAKPFADFD